MGRQLNRLSARATQTLAAPGRYADGDGLYLIVDDAGTKRWALYYRMAGRRREMGLGPLSRVSLAHARKMAAEARALVAEGTDPIDARRDRKNAPTVATPKTFGDVATDYMKAWEEVWKNPVHRRQWQQTLQVQAASLWSMPVAAVDDDAVLSVLRPIWHEKPETAKRLRGRIERILDAARVTKLRDGDNPARWRGHLEQVLPHIPKLTRGHHARLPYEDVPAFVRDLRRRSAMSARALEFIILTAARSGEVRGMTWAEIDLNAALWTVPKERMKAKREHRVPLAQPAIALLTGRLAADVKPDTLVFPNARGGQLSDMVFKAIYERMGDVKTTTHGFRSSFRDWAGDETVHVREVVEAALAHQIGNETERAYRRSDALDKRRTLMNDWAHFCVSGALSISA